LTGSGPYQAPPQGGLEIMFSRASGGGGPTRERETRDRPELSGEEGGAIEASEGLSGPPGGLKHGLERKGSPKYLRGYSFQSEFSNSYVRRPSTT
jgi:hypothetical protein